MFIKDFLGRVSSTINRIRTPRTTTVSYPSYSPPDRFSQLNDLPLSSGQASRRMGSQFIDRL